MNRTRFVACVFALAACETQQEATAPVQKPAAEVAPAAAPAHVDKSDPSCVGPVTTGAPVDLTIHQAKWQQSGSTLKRVEPYKGDKLVIGAVTDIKENTPENLQNVKTFVEAFKKAKADVIVAAGDSGMNAEQIQASLEVLAASGLPVLTIIGNREGKADYAKAMAALRAKHPNVIDMNHVRRVDTSVADFVSMPGYFNPSYLHSDDGCQYFQADVAVIGELARTSDSPVVLVSHGGPKQEGPDAIDRTAEGENVGDPMLTQAIKDAKIPFGIFGNIHEAGGRAATLDGKAAEPKKPHAEMFLNPGPADGVRWGMNDGTESVGMAAIMTIDKGKATYQVVRTPDDKAKVAAGKKPKQK